MSNGGISGVLNNTHPLQHHLMSPASPAAAAVAKNAYRKTLPSTSAASHLDDSDGNNADNDSVNSFMSSSLQGENRKFNFWLKTSLKNYLVHSW